MITIDDKLYITKEVNKIAVSYAKTVVIRKFLHELSFNKEHDRVLVSELLEQANFCNGDMNPTMKIESIHFIQNYLNTLNSTDITALHFWTIDRLYLDYLEDLEYNSDHEIGLNESNEDFNLKFGRKLAHKLYEPESTELQNELIKELQSLLINFASEFDLTLIDGDTENDITEKIDFYCN